MKNVIFIDFVCPKPYDLETLKTEGLGGTEATVVRIAEALSKSHRVFVLQHCREKASITETVSYLPVDGDTPTPDYVVHLRTAMGIPFFAEKAPQARQFLWCHDLLTANKAFYQDLPILHKNNVTAITVSNYHKSEAVDAMLSCKQVDWFNNRQYPAVITISGGIDDDLVPDSTPIDKNSLVFLSSPHKGLAQTISVFKACKRVLPELKLSVTNPGYFATPDMVIPEGVELLGSLPHAKVMEKLRSALCLFYPSTDYRVRETFGMVLAESLAVGTPVIAHTMGAVPEVLAQSRMAMDCTRIDLIKERLFQWQRERPKVGLDPAYRTSEVIKKWQELLA